MKSKLDIMGERFLLSLKLDATNLFNRIKFRKPEYMQTFAIKRTRAHFKDIFCNRYADVPLIEFKTIDTDIIASLDQFYNMVDDLRWYLDHTEEMPNTVEDHVERSVIRLEKIYSNLMLYIDASLGLINVPSSEEEEFSSSMEEEIFSMPEEEVDFEIDAVEEEAVSDEVL